MCGIAGIVGRGPADPRLLRRMAGTIGHRGPDDDDFWADAGAGIGVPAPLFDRPKTGAGQLTWDSRMTVPFLLQP